MKRKMQQIQKNQGLTLSFGTIFSTIRTTRKPIPLLRTT